MNVDVKNRQLLRGGISGLGLFPHLDRLREQHTVFNIDFGLSNLPEKPGLISVRGPRQYGKSTWLESELKKTIDVFGAGSAFYLNGDEIQNADALVEKIELLLPLYKKNVKVRRLFVDEITAIENWERAIKRLADKGDIRRILLVTTGSKATDLRRGIERLPGRKGELDRTEYLFLPIAYKEFSRLAKPVLGKQTLTSYMISGGSPIACSQLVKRKRVPEFIIESSRDWVNGETTLLRRDRASLLAVMEVIHKYGGTPVGQTKLAREAGLANNTVAAGYIEMLSDLLCVTPCFAYDEAHKTIVRRRPYKIHFTNTLVALTWSPIQIRSAEDFDDLLSPAEQGKWFEWLVAQELFRRAAYKGDPFLRPQRYWQSRENEIDFVLSDSEFLEVKRGQAKAFEYSWFSPIFPKGRLSVISKESFETDRMTGVSLEEWLLEGAGEGQRLQIG